MNVMEERALVEVAGTDVNMVCHIIGLLILDPTSLPVPTKLPSYFTTSIVMISWCLK